MPDTRARLLETAQNNESIADALDVALRAFGLACQFIVDNVRACVAPCLDDPDSNAPQPDFCEGICHRETDWNTHFLAEAQKAMECGASGAWRAAGVSEEGDMSEHVWDGRSPQEWVRLYRDRAQIFRNDAAADDLNADDNTRASFCDAQADAIEVPLRALELAHADVVENLAIHPFGPGNTVEEYLADARKQLESERA
jgi:hypothetical protein